jgi:hypothetical protein
MLLLIFMQSMPNMKQKWIFEPLRFWRISSLEVLSGFQLRVKFLDGTEGIVDMSRLVFDAASGVFTELRDPTLFSQAFPESGVVAWPSGLDLAPDRMYQEIRQNGAWLV